MVLDDAMGHAQTQPGTALGVTRGKEGIEEPRKIFFGDATTVVLDHKRPRSCEPSWLRMVTRLAPASTALRTRLTPTCSRAVALSWSTGAGSSRTMSISQWFFAAYSRVSVPTFRRTLFEVAGALGGAFGSSEPADVLNDRFAPLRILDDVIEDSDEVLGDLSSGQGGLER